MEAFLQVNQFDLVVEMLVINRTHETLQNVTVELSTHGKIKKLSIRERERREGRKRTGGTARREV